MNKHTPGSWFIKEHNKEIVHSEKVATTAVYCEGATGPFGPCIIERSEREANARLIAGDAHTTSEYGYGSWRLQHRG